MKLFIIYKIKKVIKLKNIFINLKINLEYYKYNLIKHL